MKCLFAAEPRLSLKRHTKEKHFNYAVIDSDSVARG